MPTHNYILPYQYKPWADKPQVKPLKNAAYTLYNRKSGFSHMAQWMVAEESKNHDIRFNQKCSENFVEKTEKSVDKVFPRWYYVQAVRRESDPDSR